MAKIRSENKNQIIKQNKLKKISKVRRRGKKKKNKLSLSRNQKLQPVFVTLNMKYPNRIKYATKSKRKRFYFIKIQDNSELIKQQFQQIQQVPNKQSNKSFSNKNIQTSNNIKKPNVLIGIKNRQTATTQYFPELGKDEILEIVSQRQRGQSNREYLVRWKSIRGEIPNSRYVDGQQLKKYYANLIIQFYEDNYLNYLK